MSFFNTDLNQPELSSIQSILRNDIESSDASITVIVSVRDRAPYRLKNFLRSLRAQTYPRAKIKIIVVDYDSQPNNLEDYRRLCEQHDATFYRIDYRPVWCKGEALNLALRHVQTQYTMIGDVDLIYAPNYTQRVLDFLEKTPNAAAYCRLLETGLDTIKPDTDILEDFALIHAGSTPRVSSNPSSTYIFGRGLCCTRTVYLRALRGVDEFFRGWGLEDDDLVKRLITAGVQFHCLSGETAYLHDTHPKLAGLSELEREFVARNREYFQLNHSIVRNPQHWGCSGLDIQRHERATSEASYYVVQPTKFISVIVPVYNNARALRECLRALRDQTFPKDRYEVIVVDNGSVDGVDAVVEQFPEFRYDVERQVGAYAARNRGIQLAVGEILAFTDADCVPQPDWLATGHRYFFGPHAFDYVGGRIALSRYRPSSPTPAERFDELFSFKLPKSISGRGVALTANLFCAKTAMEMLVGFNATLKSGGDREFGFRAKRLGLKTTYADDVVVSHPATKELSALLARQIRYAGGDFDWKRLCGFRRFSVLARLLPTELWSVVLKFTQLAQRAKEQSISQFLQLIPVVIVVHLARCLELLRLSIGLESRRS